ncbi:hypothetical protein J4477_01335 [Candidatus Pacearchaeota archaeon]|nr:hypothetical protein [Candidatus Pacearchaeota archaeon]
MAVHIIQPKEESEKPVIACDIDDVLFPYIQSFCAFHNRIYGTSVTPDNFYAYSLHDILGLEKEESVRRVDEFVSSDEFLDSQPMPGSEEAIEHLSQDFKIISVTSRRDNYKPATYEWINHFFPQVEDIFFSGNAHINLPNRKTKTEICLENNVGFLIEDSMHYSLDVAEAGISVYLFDHPWNQGIEHNNIIRVSSNEKDHWKNLLDSVYRDV